MRNATLAILLTLFVSTTAAVRADDAPEGDRPPGDKGGDKAAAAPAAPRWLLEQIGSRAPRGTKTTPNPGPQADA